MKEYPGLRIAIAEVVQLERELANMSKSQISKKTKLTRRTIQNIEQAQFRPTINVIFYIACALNMKASELTAEIERRMAQDIQTRKAIL